MSRRRLAPNGEVAELESVELADIGDEEWVRYELEDGTVLKTKSILAEVRKAVDKDGNTIYDDDGEPYYNLRFDSAVDRVKVEDTR